tara:strand:- start:18143 stop:19138 length:996 start_codon:yes stop_codon:yes gene_type:complete
MHKLINLNEKIFIAGSSGMVGSAIKRNLEAFGYGNINQNGLIFSPSRKELNLLDSAAVNEWFIKNKPTIVILAAAKVGGILANSNFPADFLLENLKIQTNVIESAWKTGVKRFLFLGSSCIYPKFAEQPIKEEELLRKQLEPTNESYAIAKIAGIKLCQALRKQYNFDAISLMPTNLYGPGDNYHSSNSHVFAALIQKFCNARKESSKKVICWGTGKPLREFLHVDDLGRAVVFALEKWDPNNDNSPKDENNIPIDFLNVGTGKDISIFDLAEIIAKKVGYEGEIIWDSSKPDGTPRKLLNIEKFKSLGWHPQIELEDGISSTIREFKLTS